MYPNNSFEDLDINLNQEIYCERSRNALFDPAKLFIQQQPLEFYAHQLSQLERFVQDTLSTHENPFSTYLHACNGVQYTNTALAKNFMLMPDFLNVVNMLSPKYFYSEYINVFIDCCQSMGLLSQPISWFDPYETNTGLGGITTAELFNRLINNIRNEWKANHHQARLTNRKKEANKRYIEYCNYADALFDDCRSLLVLRVDLYYKKQCLGNMTESNITSDFDHLLNNTRSNSIFNDMKGYIAKLEYGADKDQHWHVIFFFDGRKVPKNNHIFLAESIGEYWVSTITNGRGDYWNVNDNIIQYERLGRRGIGFIKAEETALRNNLKNYVIKYLCKTDQFIKPKVGLNTRLYRRGNVPKSLINTNRSYQNGIGQITHATFHGL